MAAVAGLAVESVHEPALVGVWQRDVVGVELVQVKIHTCSPFLSATDARSWVLGAQACPWLSDAVVPTLIGQNIGVGSIGVIEVGHVAESSESCASQSTARHRCWTSHCCVAMEWPTLVKLV